MINGTIFVFLIFVSCFVVFWLVWYIIHKIVNWIFKGAFEKIAKERKERLYSEELIKEKARLQAKKEFKQHKRK